MTTAHRPTFDPAQGKEALRGPAYHQRLLPAHTHLKVRQPGQGGDADNEVRDLRAELLKAEAAHFAKKNGGSVEELAAPESVTPKRQLESAAADADGEAEEDPEAKRRRILEESRDIDADSDGSGEDSSEEEDSDDEDEAAELMRELEKIKKERQAQKEKEEQERAAEEQEQREVDIARGNPLLNAQDFNMKRRWDDDVVFKNQARGTEKKDGKEFVNDLLRSDFHKRFMTQLSPCPAGLASCLLHRPPDRPLSHPSAGHNGQSILPPPASEAQDSQKPQDARDPVDLYPEMDTQPTAKQLHRPFAPINETHMNRINQDISQLLQRFENIMATATVNNPSHTATAVETYQLDVESTALIRAGEDILSLTRAMKEIWLFGKLDTLGEDEHDVKRGKKLEEDVRAVEKAVQDGTLLMLCPETKET
ncbi:uncharacterized protein N7482_010451 [Penicillium canariense]|uniref:Cwf15/Cwc15 cell cycle control protein n=1 Tax=Penicillium canariense TaxID=189055 RepID=A0A9W9HP53_9EURO|nr:uncharacterized protein N7482_010451 [Penicillium canariense]KAJ5151199.1 hypothetical protein N7482_010451 [Penicillium canariense]